MKGIYLELDFSFDVLFPLDNADYGINDRRRAIDRYLWSESKGMYFDYDTVKREQTGYETATTFWAMWAGLASPHQAAALVVKALPKFEAFGGLVSGTAESRGAVGIDRFVHFASSFFFLFFFCFPAWRSNADSIVRRPSRQWDYPYGKPLFQLPDVRETLTFVRMGPASTCLEARRSLFI